MTALLVVAVGLLAATGVYLLLARKVFSVILGLSLLTHAANLVVLAAGDKGQKAPFVVEGVERQLLADPVPQALILTAIVISMAVTLYLLATFSTGVRVLEHGRFPMTEVGIGRIADWEFEGDEVKTRMLVNGWQRSVQFNEHDMNGDGLEDIVANAFGDGIFLDANSELTIFYRTPEFDELWAEAPAEIPPGALPGALRQDIISRDGGLISSVVADFNNDGKPDIAWARLYNL